MCIAWPDVFVVEQTRSLSVNAIVSAKEFSNAHLHWLIGLILRMDSRMSINVRWTQGLNSAGSQMRHLRLGSST